LRAFLTPPEQSAGGAFETGYVDVSDAIAGYVEREPPETVAIVGGGYVGVEMAEAFREHGLETHLYQRSGHPVPPFGDAVGDAVTEALADSGVRLHLDTAVNSLDGTGRVETVETDDGSLDVDIALVGIGIRPNTELIAETGVECGDSGAITIDEYGRTAVDHVYAAGDCAEKTHTVTGKSAWVPLGLTANRAGRAIGETVAGDPSPVGEIAGTAVLKAFDLECGRAGIIDQEAAREAGFDPVAETITAGSRSGYYPGNKETTVTLVADRDSGRLLGGSIAGEDRAAIRIDTLATALENDMTVAELERLDLAYAPPFSPVWDPILVAAKVLGGEVG
jgi:NADPH-dependent 2,4-dienoyl-CoA reductase/sulfur reductase-like enzyme